MNDKDVAVRKRQQIENAQRTMFLWVAGAAAVVGIALVLSISLFEQLVFNQKVIWEMNTTVGNLQHNNSVAENLKSNARRINTDEALLDTDRLEGREPISVVLDALPSQANSSALGASLQQKLLNEGVSIESLIVNPISGIEDDGGNTSTDAGEQEIGFNFTVSAPSSQPDRLKTILRKLERSIRTINVVSLTIEQQSRRISLSVEGVAYYTPEVLVELKKEKVTP